MSLNRQRPGAPLLDAPRPLSVARLYHRKKPGLFVLEADRCISELSEPTVILLRI